VYLYSNKNRTSNPESKQTDKTVAIRGTKPFSWANNNLSNVITMPDAMHIFKALDERRIFKAALASLRIFVVRGIHLC